MVLNYIWIFFFAVAFIVALFRLVIGGDTEVFSAMMTSTFDMSKTGFEISLGLTGVLTLWMGIMKIGGRGGAVQVMSGMINPFFRRLFPGLPQDSPAHGSIMMNLAANMLGLDNAATPMGSDAANAGGQYPERCGFECSDYVPGIKYFRTDDRTGVDHGI